jgi:hypothetical protein
MVLMIVYNTDYIHRPCPSPVILKHYKAAFPNLDCFTSSGQERERDLTLLAPLQELTQITGQALSYYSSYLTPDNRLSGREVTGKYAVKDCDEVFTMELGHKWKQTEFWTIDKVHKSGDSEGQSLLLL